MMEYIQCCKWCNRLVFHILIGICVQVVTKVVQHHWRVRVSAYVHREGSTLVQFSYIDSTQCQSVHSCNNLCLKTVGHICQVNVKHLFLYYCITLCVPAVGYLRRVLCQYYVLLYCKCSRVVLAAYLLNCDVFTNCMNSCHSVLFVILHAELWLCSYRCMCSCAQCRL